MRYDIDGACVLLSGASSGIGLELARTLVRDHGCRVIGIARREAKLRAAEDMINSVAPRAFTEALASEYRGRLYITSVCPGFTKTPIFDQQKPEIAKFLRFSASPEQMAKKILRGIRRGQSLIVRGADAHAMSAVYRIAGTSGEGLCASILRIFGGTAFSECFEKTE